MGNEQSGEIGGGGAGAAGSGFHNNRYQCSAWSSSKDQNQNSEIKVYNVPRKLTGDDDLDTATDSDSDSENNHYNVEGFLHSMKQRESLSDEGDDNSYSKSERDYIQSVVNQKEAMQVRIAELEGQISSVKLESLATVKQLRNRVRTLEAQQMESDYNMDQHQAATEAEKQVKQLAAKVNVLEATSGLLKQENEQLRDQVDAAQQQTSSDRQDIAAAKAASQKEVQELQKAKEGLMERLTLKEVEIELVSKKNDVLTTQNQQMEVRA